MPYIILLIAFFVFFLGAAVLFLVGVASLVVSVGRRRWLAAGLSLALVLATALPATFTFSVLHKTAWPGRFAPLSGEQLAGRYEVEGSVAHLVLRPEGSFDASPEGWGSLPAVGTWSWHAAADWRPVDEAGTIHLHAADRVVLALPAQRGGGLLVEQRALDGWAPGEKGHVTARRASAGAPGGPAR